MKRGATAFVLMLLAAISPAAAQDAQRPSARPSEPTRVSFPALDGAVTLQGYLFAPAAEDTDKPHPAAVMMHGCSGLINPATGRFFGLYMPWVRTLTRAGYVVLVMDSAKSRDLGQTCSGPAANLMWRERPKDAYAALAFVQAQANVIADHVALMGWSQGGGAVLFAINERTAARQSAPAQALLAGMPADFHAAVAFYPGACRDDAQRTSSPPGETTGWTSKIPLLVLFGDADVWTELGPCRDFLDAAQVRGNDIELKVYQGAYHAFDAPGLKRTELPQYRTLKGQVPVLETDEAARADAFVRVVDWLKRKMPD